MIMLDKNKLNSKHEIRNPKQFSNDKNANDRKTDFEHLSIRKFEFVSNFDIRISDFYRKNNNA